jgi:hypothetical protein
VMDSPQHHREVYEYMDYIPRRIQRVVDCTVCVLCVDRTCTSTSLHSLPYVTNTTHSCVLVIIDCAKYIQCLPSSPSFPPSITCTATCCGGTTAGMGYPKTRRRYNEPASLPAAQPRFTTEPITQSLLPSTPLRGRSCCFCFTWKFNSPVRRSLGY